MLEVSLVESGGIAEEIGIEAGDKIVTLDAHEINDSIDFAFYSSIEEGEKEINIVVSKADGSILDIDALIEAGDDLGLSFPPIEAMHCGNKCIFCFVHQLPKGLRRTLYVKDEDYRLSFLMGNYVTLARIEERDVERIKEQKLSPLYISVHSTDPSTREKLLGIKPRREILDLMQELAASGIRMNSQIVVCPGINDGADLEQSINDLHGLCPSVMSLAVVPVGLTSHRNWDSELRPISKEEARKTILLVEAKQEVFLADTGSRFVFIADEYYLKADMEIPDYDVYEDFPQLENGVGMLADFRSEAADVLEETEALGRALDCSVVTGLSPLAEISRFMEAVSERTGAVIKVFPVKNRLFGDTVTVTGLISGQDIVSQLKGESLGEVLFIPDILLRDGASSLIDDYNLDMIKDKLGVPVVSFNSTPGGFLDALALWGENNNPHDSK
ncbi:MAG: DUF512 domain-containing protein [Proteobacteria bacterium]|nr:DUF512 domain-containing protein [Pseudomonadota bacterium]